jgi:hypothetical protein
MPKRVYLGNDIWETKLEDGGSYLEFAFTKTELAALEADAAKTGITEQLIKHRLFRRA